MPSTTEVERWCLRREEEGGRRDGLVGEAGGVSGDAEEEGRHVENEDVAEGRARRRSGRVEVPSGEGVAGGVSLPL